MWKQSFDDRLAVYVQLEAGRIYGFTVDDANAQPYKLDVTASEFMDLLKEDLGVVGWMPDMGHIGAWMWNFIHDPDEKRRVPYYLWYGGKAADRKEFSGGIFVCVRRWWDGVSTYHSVSVTFVADKSTLMVPMAYGHGDHFWHTVGAMLGLEDQYEPSDWKWREKYCVGYDLIDVKRMADLHGGGREPKTEKKKGKKKR